MSRNIIREQIKKREHIGARFGRALCSGTYLAEVDHHGLPFPIAIIWYRFVRNSTATDLCNIHTDDWFGRCGLMSFLLNELVHADPSVKAVVTDLGTKSDAAFMRSAGFRRLRNGTGWELCVTGKS